MPSHVNKNNKKRKKLQECQGIGTPPTSFLEMYAYKTTLGVSAAQPPCRHPK